LAIIEHRWKDSARFARLVKKIGRSKRNMWD